MEQNIYSAILRLIKTRQDDVKNVILDGNVEDWANYQFLVGQLTSLRKLDADVRDFVVWVTKKAEQLGFQVELDLHKESGSGSSEAVSPNPLATNESD